MKTVTIVTNSGIFNDDTEEVSIPQEGEIRQWIRDYMKPLSEKIAEQKVKIDEFRSATEKRLQNIQTMFQAQQDGMDSIIKRILEQQQGVQAKLNEIEQKVNVNLSRFIQELRTELQTNFTSACRADIESYFSQLSTRFAEVKEREELLFSLQKKLDEQCVISSAIAAYFCESFKAELEQKAEKLKKDSLNIQRLTACLSHTSEVKQNV